MQTPAKNISSKNEEPSEEGWFKVPYKVYPHTNTRSYPKKQHSVNSANNHNNNKNLINNTPKPIKHYWSGFDIDGTERWFLELDNGNLISNKDSYYAYLIKKYLPNEIIR
jgi:hypothetical protein